MTRAIFQESYEKGAIVIEFITRTKKQKTFFLSLIGLSIPTDTLGNFYIDPFSSFGGPKFIFDSNSQSTKLATRASI
jgi:hypothetical protein